MANYLPLPPIFNLSDDWIIYEARLNQFFLAYDIKDDKRKAAILLTALSNDVFKVLTNVCYPEGPETKTLKDICKVLKGQFSPVVSVYSERIKFYEAMQEDDETVNEWVARLKCLSMNCKFEDYLEEVVKDKFVCGLKKGPLLDRVCEFQHCSHASKRQPGRR